MNYKRILVAVDGSKGASSALKRGIELVKENQAHLDILKVMELNSFDYGNSGMVLDGEQIYQLEQSNEQYLKELENQLLQKAGLKKDQFNVHLRFGNPKTVIVEDFQPEYKNDLIIVGSTGKNFIERLVVGSVASFVTREAKCDVLIVKEDKKSIKKSANK